MATDTTRLTIELEVLLRNLNRTLRGLDQVKRKLDSVANVRLNQRSTTATTDRQVLASQRLALAQQRLQIQQQRLGVQTQELANRQERARQAAERLARANERLTQTSERVNRVLPRVRQSLNSLGAAALRVGGGLRSVGASASILISGPLAALGVLASKSAADIDAIRNRLIATEGSVGAANKRLAQLRKLADESAGVTRRTALDTFAILATLGEVTESTINKQIKAFGRLNAAFTIDDQQVFFRNLVQIFQQGFEVKDIREALGRVPIFNSLLQSAFGTADPEKLRALKAAGKLTLDTFLAGLATAVETDPILSQVGESIRVRLAKTLERLTDALEPLGRAILGPLERIVLAIEPIILRVAAAFDQLSPGIQNAIVAAGLLAIALGPVLFVLGGLASGLGVLFTVLAEIVALAGTIGLPAIVATLAGLLIIITEITAVLAALGLAWKTNFLNIRQLTSDAAIAVIAAFNRIRAVVDEVIQRILPTLESITAKVVGGVQEIWEKYGSTVVRIVGTAFGSIVQVTESFLRLFGNVVDLILKLVDNDWRGAWRAFARIVVSAMDSILPIVTVFINAFQRGLNFLIAFIVRKAIEFANAGSRLAIVFIDAISGGLIGGSSRVRDALTIMLITAMSGVAFGPIAQAFVARFIDELRKAAAVGIPGLGAGPNVSVDPGFEAPTRRRPSSPPSPPGGDKGGAARRLASQAEKLREAQDKLAEQREKDRLALLESFINRQFDLTKDALAREQRQLDNSFEDRLASIRNFFQERLRIQQAEIDAEIRRELKLTDVIAGELAARKRIIEKEFQTELANIKADTRLKGQAKTLAIQTAELNRQRQIEEATTEAKQKSAEVDANLLKLDQQRKDAVTEIGRAEVELTRELTKQRDQIRFDLLDEQGRTSDAEAGRLKQRFRETIRDLRIDLTGLSVDLQRSINEADFTTLQQRLDDLPEPVRDLVELLDIGIKRAQIIEAAQLVDDLSAQLRLDEERIQNRVLDGVIGQRDAQAAILAIQRQYRAVLLDILAGELKKAEAIKDQGQITAIQTQIEEVKRLGVEIDEVGQQINQAFISDIQSGISGIFSGARRGFEGLRDAAISFGERLLDTLNDIAATSIVNKLEGLFKPDATNTQGTVGGFFSKLFGLAPKQQADATAASATLQTGATTAAATLTTGATTAGAGFSTSVLTSAASFASLIISAGAAFAASVAASSAVQAVGGLGGTLGGIGAASGIYPAVPGGVVRIVEGGFPEAVLTTDPKYAQRQVAILRAFLRETRGLGGRIRGLAIGGFALPDLTPSVSSASVGAMNLSGLDIGGDQRATNLRILNLLDKRQLVGGHLRSAEGAHDILNIISENSDEIGRRLNIR